MAARLQVVKQLVPRGELVVTDPTAKVHFLLEVEIEINNLEVWTQIHVLIIICH